MIRSSNLRWRWKKSRLKTNTLSECRFLFGHCAARAEDTKHNVYVHFRDGALGRLDCAMGRNDLGSRPEKRPAAPAFCRPDAAHGEADSTTIKACSFCIIPDRSCLQGAPKCEPVRMRFTKRGYENPWLHWLARHGGFSADGPPARRE